MKKTLMAFLVTMGMAAPLMSQTATNTVLWDYSAASLAEITAAKHTVLIDNVIQSGTPQCSIAGAGVACRLTIPKLTPAAHTVTVQVERDSVVYEASTKVDLTTNRGPNAPKVQVIFTLP
jgi:hypothetical protein